jgi:transposase InsO family protein
VPWRENTAMSLRLEFVQLARQHGANIRELCRRFDVSAPTAYKWLARFQVEGSTGLADRSRRPCHSPRRTPADVEALVVAERDRYPARGGRKLRRQLTNAGRQAVPAASTITAILRRHARLDPAESAKHRAWQRFEHPAPNQLWQMDFKGHFRTAGGRCHPLTVLDDHSRFAICLQACADERGETVKQYLTAAFRRYGLPERMLMDNGSPWGDDWGHPYTPLTAWLIRLGIQVTHGRPYHPQTQGKDERFHRTLSAELLRERAFSDLKTIQQAFDCWRDDYNLVRPHEALELAVPASRYRASQVAFPEVLPPIDYGPGAIVRMVSSGGRISFHGRVLYVGKGFRGQPVALRRTTQDHLLEVYYCHQRIITIDLTHSPNRTVQDLGSRFMLSVPAQPSRSQEHVLDSSDV